ncbi:hemolymph lipopolysaccharide-binding protein-like [Periplaneta americana]|uniref:hemolymph lipopolysaccharide-binding protein-like n=1 Tax=Periplaneta americana TaxID=6978 RepID=UPI0037E72BC8
MSRLAALCVLLFGVQALWDGRLTASELKCNSPKSLSLKLSLTGRRNRTGHWTSQAQVEYKTSHGDPDNQETAAVDVDIEQNVTKCQGDEIVQIVATTIAPPFSPPIRRPGADYELITEFGYYKLHTSIKNWLDAYDVCRQENAHLLIINSDKEAKAVQRLWIRHPKSLGDWRDGWSYAGIHDKFKEGNFVTIFNQPLSEIGYTKWSKEPSGTVSENCGMINFEGEYGDAPCNVLMTFICEQEL